MWSSLYTNVVSEIQELQLPGLSLMLHMNIHDGECWPV